MKKIYIYFIIILLLFTGCQKNNSSSPVTPKSIDQESFNYIDSDYNSFFSEDSNHNIYFMAGTSLYKNNGQKTELLYDLYSNNGFFPFTSFCCIHKEEIYTIAINKDESLEKNQYVINLIKINYNNNTITNLYELETNIPQNMFIIEDKIYIYYAKDTLKNLIIFDINASNVAISHESRNAIFENNYTYLINKYNQISSLKEFDQFTPFHYLNNKVYTQDNSYIYEFNTLNNNFDKYDISQNTKNNIIRQCYELINNNWYSHSRQGIVKYDTNFKVQEILLPSNQIKRINIQYPGVSFAEI